MASLSQHPCAEIGCAVLVPVGTPRCVAHGRVQEARRGSTVSRGYDADHRRLRKAKLAVDPFCQIRTHCQGAIANEIDHIIPISQRPDLRLEWTNVQSACKPCNVAKRNRENSRETA
jgi:5-methylcytosine-specific restriction enzyme A